MPPDAGAIVYARYHHAINSTELVTRLRQENSVLVVPGDHFGMDGYLRLGFGDEPDTCAQALERVARHACGSAALRIADYRGLRIQRECGSIRIRTSNPQSAIRNPQSAIRNPQ